MSKAKAHAELQPGEPSSSGSKPSISTQNVNLTYTDQIELKFLQEELEALEEAYEEVVQQEVDQRNPGKHDKAVKDAKSVVDDKKRDIRAFMREAVPRYELHMESLKNHAQVAATTGIPSTPPRGSNREEPRATQVVVKEMKIADPSKYNGTSTEDYTRFKFECQNIIKVRTTSLDTDDKKIAFIGSRMEGDALNWYELWSKDRDRDVEGGLGNRHTLVTFMTTMDNIFKDPMEVQTARNTLAGLKQESKPFNAYQVLYLSTCIKAELDPNTQIQHFLRSLNPKIVREWHPSVFPTTFTDLVKELRTSIELNKTLAQVVGGGGSKSGGGGGSRPDRTSTSSKNWPPDQTQYDGLKPGPFYSNPDRPGYKARERLGWCTRCGMKNHKEGTCRVYPHNKTNTENFEKWVRIKNDGTGVNAVQEEPNIIYYPSIPKDVVEAANKSTFSAYSRLGIVQQKVLPLLLIKFTVTKKDGSKAVGKALVDSGANRSLMGRKFVNRNHIDTTSLHDLLRLTLADGKTTSVATKQTSKLEMEIQGHKGNLQVPILENHGYDLILGLDWLASWNPCIDWSTQTLIFNDAKSSTPLITQPIQKGNIQVNTHNTTPPIDEEVKSQIPPTTWPMSEYPQIFDMEKQSYLPQVKEGWDFDVEFKDGVSLPRSRPLFRLPVTQRKAVEEYVHSELASGKIRISHSPVAANLFFVPKGDSTTELRPCVDYRDLNSCTKDDKYPLPPLAELIQSLVGGDWYTKLDWRWAYNNLRIVPGSEWKFAFKCHMGQYEPLVMPFGPKQAPSHMQRYVSEMCKDFAREGWLFNILDDFVIKTVGSVEDHKTHIRRYLKRIQELGIFIKESKCLFFQKEIPFVGFMVNRFGYWKQAEKMETIERWGVPTSVKEVRSFIGFVNFYRPFAKRLSIIAQPLFDLTKKSHDKFVWLPTHQDAFEKVKECLLRDIFLLFPDHSKPFIIHFDSSDLGTGSVLQQYDINGVLRPLEFYSKKWNTAEFNYSTPDKELYGLVLALKHWYSILFGASELVVYTDHKTLRDFSKTQLLKPRHARWALVLEDFRSIMKIHWIPGKDNEAADACSRDPRFKLTEVESMERFKQTLLSKEVFEEAELNVLFGIELVDFMEPAEESEDILLETDSGGISFIPPQGSQSNEFTSNVINDTEEDSQLDDSDTDSDEEGETQDTSLRTSQPYQKDIHDNLEKQKDVMSLYHDSKLGGHLGFRKTLEIIRRRYWWKGMRKDILDYVSSCDVCQKSKKSRKPPAGKLMPLPIPERNWQHITMDFVVKLPKSSTFDSILVIVDRRSKQAHFIPCKESITAEGTAMLLFQHVVCKHGLPQSIVSDRGPQFRSRFWKKLLELLGSKAALSTAYHPQTDGQSERVNQTLEQYLRIFTSYEQDDWSELLPLAELVYNNSYNESIGMSPFYAVTGQDAEVEAFEEITPIDKSNPPEAGRIKDHFSRIYGYLDHHLKRAQERYKETADMYRREEESYQINDKVLLSTRNIRTLRPTKKLDVTYVGPYRIKRKINPVTYELELPPGSRLHPVYHVDLLKPYIHSEDEHRTTIQPPSLRIDDEPGYVIRDIVDVEKKGNGFRYLIDWEGYGPEDRTWETRSYLKDDDLLRVWHENNPNKPSPFVSRNEGGDDDTIVSIVLSPESPSSYKTILDVPNELVSTPSDSLSIGVNACEEGSRGFDLSRSI